MTDGRMPETDAAIDNRWVAFVHVTDRSGTLTALSETFSSRGVSFESFHTLAVLDGQADISITFRASPRLARVLVRTLERLAVVRGVELEHADDPRVRAVAVLDSGVHLGALREISAQVADALADGGRLVALTILPPDRSI